MTKDVYAIAPKDNRQAQIEALDIGDSISVSRRFVIHNGFRENLIAEETHKLRSILDQQVMRARRRYRDQEYTVENVSGLTRAGALMLTAVVTRVA